MKFDLLKLLLAVLCCAPLTSALDDGPYVFYTDNAITVHSIANSKVITERYPNESPVTITVPSVGTVQSFTVSLRKTFTVSRTSHPMVDTILMVSDFEGNLEACVHLLKNTGVINESLEWTYGKGHLFFNGDQVDRGEHVPELLWFIYKLQGDAEKAGGCVHYIIGNHEQMNMTGDLRYVAPKYLESADLLEMDYMDLYTRDTELGRWLRSCNAIELIGSCTIVHAGISAAVARSGLTVNDINRICRDNLDGIQHGNTAVQDFTGFTSETFLSTDFDSTSLVVGTWGPLWYRGYFEELRSSDYEPATDAAVDSVLDYLNTSHIVVGHSIVDSVTTLYGDDVIAMDVHHSRTFTAATGQGYIEAFLIERGTGYSIKTTGEKRFVCTVDSLSGTTTRPKRAKMVYGVKRTNEIISLPVPASGHYSLRIVNSNGRVICSENAIVNSGMYTINTAGFSTGTLICRICNGKGFCRTYRFVVSR